MTVKSPTLDELAHIADSYAFHLTEYDLESFQGLMDGMMASYARLDALTEPTLPVTYARTPGYRPQPEDNPLGAWYWRTEVKGAPSGLLAGKTIALKDNICLAGVPMMNGSSVLEGYVPDIDASLVTRMLDAGGTILGKAVCEHLCASGGSHTSDTWGQIGKATTQQVCWTLMPEASRLVPTTCQKPSSSSSCWDVICRINIMVAITPRLKTSRVP